jgi:uncharacterized membrane protein YadS
VVVKLTRVALLAPLVAAVALTRPRAEAAAGRRPPVLPLFVAGFVAAVGLRSTALLPAGALAAAAWVQSVLLVAALAGLGTGIRLALLRRTGSRALALGLASWVLVAGVAYAGVRLVQP